MSALTESIKQIVSAKKQRQPSAAFDKRVAMEQLQKHYDWPANSAYRETDNFGQQDHAMMTEPSMIWPFSKVGSVFTRYAKPELIFTEDDKLFADALKQQGVIKFFRKHSPESTDELVDKMSPNIAGTFYHRKGDRPVLLVRKHLSPVEKKMVQHHETFHARTPILGQSELLAHLYGGARSGHPLSFEHGVPGQLLHFLLTRPERAVLEPAAVVGAYQSGHALYTKTTTKTAAVQLTSYQQELKKKLQNQHGVVVAWGLGSGKCRPGTEKVFTNRGLVELQTFFEHLKEDPRDEILETPKDEIIVQTLEHDRIVPKNIKHIYRQRINDYVLKFTTDRGTVVKTTFQHPLLINNGGILEWKRAADLKRGDFLSLANKVNIEQNSPIPDDLLKLLSWQITEGNESHYTKNKVATFITQKDKSVLEELKQIADKYKFTARLSKSKDCWVLRISGGWKQYLENNGYKWGYLSKDKQFPDWITLVPIESAKIVLRAVFDAEASMGKANIEFISASKNLVDQIQALLLKFGIHCGVHSKFSAATNGKNIKRLYYRLNISGYDLEKFYNLIGFGYNYKQQKLARASNKKRNPNTGTPLLQIIEQLKLNGFSEKEAHLKLPYKTYSDESIRKLKANLAEYINGTREQKLILKHNFKSSVLAQKICKNKNQFVKLATAVDGITNLPLVYERIKNIELEFAEYVYDLEVDDTDYDNKNYLSTPSAVVCHNTIGAISAADQFNTPAVAVVPASLRNNFHKELAKAQPKNKFTVMSYEKFVKDPSVAQNKVLIFDEAHRLKSVKSKRSKAAQEMAAKAKRVILLTGTPIQNKPETIAPLINIAAGKKVLPAKEKVFDQRYVGHYKYTPNLFFRLLGAKPVDENYAKNMSDFQARTSPYIVFNDPAADPSIPKTKTQYVDVPMTPTQVAVYNMAERKAPKDVVHAVETFTAPKTKNIPKMNAFLSATRQISDTPDIYLANGQQEYSPKLLDIAKKIQQNKGQSVIYSNYLGAGIKPLGALLQKDKISYNTYTGKLNDKERNKVVQDFNNKKYQTLVVSSAGGEGLDLQHVRNIYITDPYWNNEKIQQVIGRGTRKGALNSLPPSERVINVYRYESVFPERKKFLFFKPKQQVSTDQYLNNMSNKKTQLNNEFLSTLKSSKMTKEAIASETFESAAAKARSLAKDWKDPRALQAKKFEIAAQEARMRERLAMTPQQVESLEMKNTSDSLVRKALLNYSGDTKMNKQAEKLTYTERKDLPTGVFAIPSERKYPIEDEDHARAALMMVSTHGTPAEQEQVRKAVAERFPNLEKQAGILGPVRAKSALLSGGLTPLKQAPGSLGEAAKTLIRPTPSLPATSTLAAGMKTDPGEYAEAMTTLGKGLAARGRSLTEVPQLASSLFRAGIGKMGSVKQAAHQKTYPISRFVDATGAVASLGLSPIVENRALQGMANSGHKRIIFTTPSEERVVKAIGKEHNDKKYPISRAMTDPLVATILLLNPLTLATQPLGNAIHARALLGRAALDRPGFYARSNRMIKEIHSHEKQAEHFVQQDHPKKVKEIYKALEKEHPEYSARKKAMIANAAYDKMEKKAVRFNPANLHQVPTASSDLAGFGSEATSIAKVEKTRAAAQAAAKVTKPVLGGAAEAITDTAKTLLKAGETMNGRYIDVPLDKLAESLTKEAKKLSYESRKKMSKKEFAVPAHKNKNNPTGKGAYPIDTKARARDALARVSANGSSGEIAEVRRKVHAKYPDIKIKALQK